MGLMLLAVSLQGVYRSCACCAYHADPDGSTSAAVPSAAAGHSGRPFWILTVRYGLEDMYRQYPWIAYGTDWLAFGHLVIALFFVGALFRPDESRSTLYAGISPCVLVVPLALICGPIRGILLYCRLIDCSFGDLGVLPLVYCLRLLRFIPAR